ncbi:hypothetical protein BC941DRAFT_454313 [Chlamydoabsidia padenii]|nr:hypothetical protein BC941DRAFT_454313 [Chlamydoabsidia padenii]
MHHSYIQVLPDELILSIFNYLKQDNHLDLVPISNSCRRFKRLASDHLLWNEWVVMDTSSSLSSGMIRLPLSSSSHKDYQAREIALVDPTKTGLWALKDLLDQNDQRIPVALSIFTNHSSDYWSMLIGQPNTFKSISILPLHHSSPPASSLSIPTLLASSPMPAILNPAISNPDQLTPYQVSDYHPAAVDPSSMCDFIERMHSRLELFTFPLLSLHELINTSMMFPKVHTLNVGLSAFPTSLSGLVINNGDDDTHLIDWSKVKHTFPNLQDLTLHPLSSTDMKEFWKTIRSLWAAQNLFPWLHSMTIQTNDSASFLTYPINDNPLSPSSLANHLEFETLNPQSNITKDEIIATLSRLKDLTRINTGSWDIVALDQL